MPPRPAGRVESAVDAAFCLETGARDERGLGVDAEQEERADQPQGAAPDGREKQERQEPRDEEPERKDHELFNHARSKVL